jgi:hypothetical protein
LGLPVPPAHTNAIIMILTLKLVGLAFEIHDSKDAASGKNTLVPSFLDVYHYSFCHAGLITGTVGENIIAPYKIRNNYGAIQSFIFPIMR